MYTQISNLNQGRNLYIITLLSNTMQYTVKMYSYVVKNYRITIKQSQQKRRTKYPVTCALKGITLSIMNVPYVFVYLTGARWFVSVCVCVRLYGRLCFVLCPWKFIFSIFILKYHQLTTQIYTYIINEVYVPNNKQRKVWRNFYS